jgi:HEPN pEK499 p136
MKYTDLIRDFAERTQHNLKLTSDWRAGALDAGFNEVTQLINSLLGLVVLPRALILDYIDPIPVTATGIDTDAWHAPFEIAGNGSPSPDNLPELIKGLRNAVAHAALEPTTDGHDITGVEFTFYTGRRWKSPPVWRVTFRLFELETFLEGLSPAIKAACARRDIESTMSG